MMVMQVSLCCAAAARHGTCRRLSVGFDGQVQIMLQTVETVTPRGAIFRLCQFTVKALWPLLAETRLRGKLGRLLVCF